MTRTRFTRKSIVRPGKRQTFADPILARYAKQIRGFAKRTVNDIIKIGVLLTKAKKRAGHGGYLSWLDREFGWSADTAQNFVNVFELSRKSKFRNFRSLPTSALYLLAKKSTPEAARAAVARRVETGGKITLSEVRNTVYGPRRMVGDLSQERRGAYRLTSYPSSPPEPASEQRKPITAEVLQAVGRRSLVSLIFDVVGRLPRDQSFEEARAVVENVSERQWESFSEAVATLHKFVGLLRRALNERPIKVPARRRRSGTLTSFGSAPRI